MHTTKKGASALVVQKPAMKQALAGKPTPALTMEQVLQQSRIAISLALHRTG